MSAQLAIAALIALGTGLACVRLLYAAWRAAPGARPRGWRIAALLALQIAAAFALYRTLLPPPRTVAAHTLTVLTADAARAGGENDPGARRIALPEADAPAAAERVPDLGTALRRHPDVARVHVRGAGLPARDLEAARGRALTFAPAPLPQGLVELWSPPRLAVGATLPVRGRVDGVRGGSVELLDPAGRRLDRAALAEDGRFVLRGEVPAAGSVLLRVRVRDAAQRPIEDAAVPVLAVAGAAQRILMLAGAPNPELKYLRRWAADAGLALRTEIALGGGLHLGDPPPDFTAETLREFDLVVIDERALQSMREARFRTLRAAVRDGLGLLIRIGGAPGAQARARLRALGFALDDVASSSSVRLAGDAADTARAVAAEAADDPDAIGPDASESAEETPALTRRGARLRGDDAGALLRDAGGEALALWRAEGRGRVAVWTLGDSYRLVLAGHGDRHAALWRDAFAKLARGEAESPPRLQDMAWAGQRAVLCGLNKPAAVIDPEGVRTPLLPDPATGAAACAATWPTRPGWHRVGGDGLDWPFYVHAADALPGIRAGIARERTQMLAAAAAPAPTAARAQAPGARWPWFLLWLALSAPLWWLERSRYGRAPPQAPAVG